MPYYVYIIETETGTYYTGQTNDLKRRLNEHVSGNSKSAAYFHMHQPKYLVYTEECSTRGDALRRERQIKRNRRLKLFLIGDRRDLQGLVNSETIS
ncbi:MAG: GIY-YIG nuclease family protein [Candidatus Thorarchaeota archaeon]|nr:GIY-YIG nuclease family protein [Candidatus Thorarchaeota archaeon]